MSNALWTWDALVAASAGRADGACIATITGFSIDSRSIAPGEVFVALKDQRDGHDFVTGAFAKGAAAALVARTYQRRPGDGPLVRVDDTLDGLRHIASAARARLSRDARVIGVTGSVGKTTTKEMLRACLSRLGRTHAPEKSFNNHWGVPLTLARMPADTQFAVIEMGMNHAGEITPLTTLARPHAVIITTVESVHIEHFASEEGIADAKAEIISGLEPGGTAILNRDNRHFERLAAAARRHGAALVSFGKSASADVHLVAGRLHKDRSELEVATPDGRLDLSIAAPGDHMLMNALAVVAALRTLTGRFDRTQAGADALAGFGAQAGRGQREILKGNGGQLLLADESYNANPASMRAALMALALVPRSEYRRRIAVLGDMLELGHQSRALHEGLAEAIDAAEIDLVFAAGPHMKSLFDRLAPARRGAWAPSSAGLAPLLKGRITEGDAVVVKGSYGSRMGPLVDAIKSEFSGNKP